MFCRDDRTGKLIGNADPAIDPPQGSVQVDEAEMEA